MFRKFFKPKNPHATHPANATPLIPERRDNSPKQNGAPAQVFSKVFRYRLPDGATTDPQTVEIAGSFTHWQKVALLHNGKLDGWHTTIHHIPGNRTHHYMMLVDGQPTLDHTCDGLAVAHGPLEEKFVISTDKGPRVMMLFAQTR